MGDAVTVGDLNPQEPREYLLQVSSDQTLPLSSQHQCAGPYSKLASALATAICGPIEGLLHSLSPNSSGLQPLQPVLPRNSPSFGQLGGNGQV